MRTPDKLCEIVRAMVDSTTSLPVFVKMRVFEDQQRTVKLAQRLEALGCDALTVHGRTIKKKRSGSQLANWDTIKAIKASVRIPVISNGNIRHMEDVKACLDATGCDGVMSACGLLSNPSLFSEGESPSSISQANEYLECAVKYGATPKQIKKHMHWILNPKRGEIHRVRSRLSKARRAELIKNLHRVLTALEASVRCFKSEKKESKHVDDECSATITTTTAAEASLRLDVSSLRASLEAWTKEEEEERVRTRERKKRKISE